MDHHGFPLNILFFLFIALWSIVSAVRRGNQIGRGTPGAGRSNNAGSSNGLLNLFALFKKTDPQVQENIAASQARQSEIIQALQSDAVPSFMLPRLQASRDGTAPWVATLTPAELMIARSHGIRPIAAVSATCWMQYGYSWTKGHEQGWHTALERLRNEARAVGANAVLDVKMRTVPMDIANSMDFSLVGTAVKIDGLPPSPTPVIATVPALEFAKLLEANIVPTGIAIGAEFQWMADWRGGTNLFWAGNTEVTSLSQLWEQVRRTAHSRLRTNAAAQGNGVLAHTHFSQMFEQEGNPKQFLARYIVIATTIDMHETFSPGLKRLLSTKETIPLDFRMVVDMHAGKTPLAGTVRHNQSYPSNEEEGAI